MELLFDEAAHCYRYGGVVVPSVTQILGDDGQIVPNYPSGPYRVRGSRVHKATHLWDEGEDLNRWDIGADILPYIQSYVSLMSDLQWDWFKIEHRMFHPVLCYAGTADRIRIDPPGIVDLKTGYTKKETGLQLSGYTLLALQDPEIKKAWGNIDPAKVERIKFELQKDGSKAEPTYYQEKEAALDFDCFKGLVAKYKWKRRK